MDTNEIEEDFFNYIIDENQDADKLEQNSEASDKENVQLVFVGRRLNTTPQQMREIAESILSISGKELTSKETLSFWDKLTDELNKMGPPYRSRAEWRKVWSMHKTNRKRKHSSVEPHDTQSEDQSSSAQRPKIQFSEQLATPIGVESKNVGTDAKFDTIQKGEAEVVHQSGDEINVSAGVQRSNSNVTCAPFDEILVILKQILDKQAELVNQSGDEMQQNVSAGVQRSNSNVTCAPFDEISVILKQILDKQTELVNQVGQFSEFCGKLLDKQNEYVSQSGDKVQRDVSAGLQRSNFNVGTCGPLDEILAKLIPILDKVNTILDRQNVDKN
ncbi:uncharacterized protein LOC119066222 [Bradysia coprophila]|uniref:uncharacterized protein LOC119066222 n=1 Tax=Bradysia coprophila TaxID=38358 RepID=UPI00187D8F62|nr:uncharacterized protein LOC119066222 [Bradysia coprophila]